MSRPKAIHIDIETYSETELTSTGVYRYAEDPFFKIQLFSYGLDDGPVKLLDLEQGDKIPKRIIRYILDKRVEKWAHNAQFERVSLSVHIFGRFGVFLDPTNWRDTAVYGRTLGLPGSLAQMAKALELDDKKDTVGKRLINYFSKPCKPTKVNGGRTRNLPEHAPEDWKLYGEYNIQDVVVERSIHQRLQAMYPKFPAHEWEFYEMDQRIADTGIPVDLDFVEKAIKLKNRMQRKASRQLKRLTGVESINAKQQLKAWAAEQGYPITSLDEDHRNAYLEDPELGEQFPEVYKMVELIDQAGGTAVAKYDKIWVSTNNDGRLRGQLIFYGAGATGRFAGKGVQVQNLPRMGKDVLKHLDELRGRVKAGKRVTFKELTQLCRTSFAAIEGTTFGVSDYSSIEARVTPWYAGEKWAIEAFEAGQDIYVATAVKMYHVDYGTAKNEYRQKGKQATLALGYGGAVGALVAMGALNAGIPENELPELVKAWRQANPSIVRFWRDTEKAVKAIIHHQGKKKATLADGKLTITYRNEYKLLQIWLPGGRALSYYGAHLDRKKNIRYLGGIKANGEAWYKDTFGGKLVENIVQATARDLLCEALLRIEKAGYRTLFHVHDEAIVEVPKDFEIEELNELMASPLPKWAKGLPLGSEGDTVSYYRKV